MIRTLLVANRGEVASRVFRTARALGIRTVAIYSDADAELRYLTEADRAVCIGPAPSADSYLNIAAILEAARHTGADAIHPGYGFLAERAEFAAAVLEAGLTWVGPSPAAIEAMGDKARARQLAVAQQVPVVPGYDDPSQELADFQAAAEAIGYPLLVKAAAGGGGRGMRVVDGPDALPDALDSARREALSAFGDGTLLLEKYIEKPRHIEVQVFGDTHGNIVHLFERECSIQRKHQKIVEEAPSSAVSPALREQLGQAAIRLARAVDYVGAGTVEFLLGADGGWAFLEMNTRLQVEHEVTELITGVDLVAWQLAIAEGAALPLTQQQLQIDGHAIEVRVYAEDPSRDWMPSHGPLHRLDLEGERVSATYRSGDTVGVHYDPMLAKLLVHGSTRAVACRKLSRAVQLAWAPGLVSNLPLLRQIAEQPEWLSGDLDTHFLGRTSLPQPPPIDPALTLIGATALLVCHSRPPLPAAIPQGFRVAGPEWEVDRWSLGAEPIEVRHRLLGSTLEIEWEARSAEVILHGHRGDELLLSVDGIRQRWRVIHIPSAGGRTRLDDGDAVYIHSGEAEGFARLVPRFPPPAPPEIDPGSCRAPTPGTVRAVSVAPGEVVTEGQALLVLEAMKMEHTVHAPADGTITEVRVSVGDTVDEGELLVLLDSPEATARS